MTDHTALPAADRLAEGILRGERVAFTGTLASMTHRQAADLVVRHGGEPVVNVSQLTTLLVIGEEGWPLEEDGRISVKLEQAQQLRDRGQSLRLLHESEWLQALGLETPDQRQQSLYTPAMLSQILKLSVHEIRRWERMGLIRPIKRIYRLPYFDFQEVAEARRLSEWIRSGISVERLSEGLQRLNELRPLGRPLDQLQILANGRRLLYRDPAGLVDSSTGQRFFEFEREVVTGEPEVATLPIQSSRDAPRTAQEWRQEGCARAEHNEIAESIQAFRRALIAEPGDPLSHVHLAESLYRAGNRLGAIERYYAAVELDHDYIEAWTQLGCVLSETDQIEAAIDAFRTALDIHPDYPDAHFHLAELLQRSGQADSARGHWETYLRFDRHGPWAETARQRLELSEGDAPSPPDGEERIGSRQPQ
ncbi:MAG: tetratricopeptide repeat protein [Planctomycetaceae bacterium]